MIRALAARKPDGGAALVMVLMAMIILAAVLMTSLAFTLQNAQPTRTDADGKAATAAAQAGINDYLARLEANSSYWLNNGTDPSNSALGAGGQALSSSGSSFKYKVLSSDSEIRSSGTIKLMVTGWAKNSSGVSVEKKMFATLRVKGFLNFIYMSDYEVQDPNIAGSASCDDYYYASTTEGSKRRSGGCSSYEIQWAGGDVVSGPLHSNDALQVNGAANFKNKQTESSWPTIIDKTSGKTWWGTASAGSLPGYIPLYAEPLPLPSSNALLLNYVKPNRTGNSSITTGPGCYYSGPTEIVFQGNSMKIRSPKTTASDIPSECYDKGNPTTWQTISPIPEVIYVGASTGSCSGTSASTTFTYPLSGEYYTSGTPSAVAWTSSAGSTVNYGCSRGTVYVQGQANTSTTVAAADDVVVTGDLTVPSLGGGAAIGLIGGNAVWVYHPVKTSGSSYVNYGGFDPANTINASILALNHSFLVANWGKGAGLGNLNLTGALAQKYRGPVGTSGGTGYIKNYVYDTRLKTMQPPYFIQPTGSPWGVVSVAAP